MWGGREGCNAWRTWGRLESERLLRRARSKQPGLEDVEKKDFLEGPRGNSKEFVAIQTPRGSFWTESKVGKKGVPAGTQWDRGGLIYKSFQFSVF